MTNYIKSKSMIVFVVVFLICLSVSVCAASAEGQTNVLSIKDNNIGFLIENSQDLIPINIPGPVFKAKQHIYAVVEVINNTSEIVNAYPKISVYSEGNQDFKEPLYNTSLDMITFNPNEDKKIVQDFITQTNADKYLITIALISENGTPLSEEIGLRYVVSNSGEKAEPAQVTLKDVKNTKYEESVQNLMSRGIINGYPDGTYKPNQMITRAEIVKMICSASGVDAESLKHKKSKFKDVVDTHWAKGYINWAEQTDIVKGYPGGLFKPNDNITYAEAITIMVKLITGEELEGTWPDVYLSEGKQLGITNNIEFKKSSDRATRGDVTIMGWNVLQQVLK